jgi:hypothetical protein
LIIAHCSSVNSSLLPIPYHYSRIRVFMRPLQYFIQRWNA